MLYKLPLTTKFTGGVVPLAIPSKTGDRCRTFISLWEPNIPKKHARYEGPLRQLLQE
jgi:hypothetical protein